MKKDWEKLVLEKAGGGKSAKVLFCFEPNGIIIEEEVLPIFKKHFENDDVEFLPLVYEKKTWYILHCCEVVDVKHTIDENLLGDKYYLDKNEFMKNNYYSKNVFKLLGKGVIDVIDEELYTEKMIEFINSFKNVGIRFEEAGAIVEEPKINNINDIVNLLFVSAIRIIEKMEENNTIDYANMNYFYDSEALDIGITLLYSNKDDNSTKYYYSLLDEKIGFAVTQLIKDGISIKEIIDNLFLILSQRISKSYDFVLELEQLD